MTKFLNIRSDAINKKQLRINMIGIKLYLSFSNLNYKELVILPLILF